MNDIKIFESAQGEIQVKLEQETVWLSQITMAKLFETSTDNISLHLKNIYSEAELEETSTTEDYSVVRKEGNRQVKRKLKHYNLDAIISVGYRVKSHTATKFRQWATQLLKQHLTQGYTLNKQRMEDNALELEAALKLIKKASLSDDLTKETGKGLVEIVSRYTQTFLWLQRYDEGLLNEPSGTDSSNGGGILQTFEQASSSLAQLKQGLISRGEATNLFAQPKGDGLSSLLGNLELTVFGEPAYPTIQSKAAHLLYFVVKNHPFTDGNKRSGAFLFVDFLHRNNLLLDEQDNPIINDTGLAALTLLVAESKPEQKDVLISLIMNMLTPESALTIER